MKLIIYLLKGNNRDVPNILRYVVHKKLFNFAHAYVHIFACIQL